MSDQPIDRTKFIGGSDIAAVLNISPWRSAVQLWADKIKPPMPEGGSSGRDPKARGKRWEATVAEMLVEELERRGHRVQLCSHNHRYIDPVFPMFACEIDFEVILDDDTEITNVELKTVHPFKSYEWGTSGSDGAPLWYVAQAAWGLGITKRKRCLIAALFGADELRVFPVERDEDTIGALRAAGAKFWTDHVVAKVPPPPTRPIDADVMFPKDSSAQPLLADDEMTTKLLRLRALSKEIDARTAEYDSLEFQIKLAMGERTEIVVGEKTAATWKERKTTWLDQAALREDHPKIHKEYTVKQSKRVFALKQFKGKPNDSE